MSKTKKIVFTVLLGALIVFGVYLLVNTLVYIVKEGILPFITEPYAYKVDLSVYIPGIIFELIKCVFFIVSEILLFFQIKKIWYKQIQYIKYTREDYIKDKKEKRKKQLQEELNKLK